MLCCHWKWKRVRNFSFLAGRRNEWNLAYQISLRTDKQTNKRKKKQESKLNKKYWKTTNFSPAIFKLTDYFTSRKGLRDCERQCVICKFISRQTMVQGWPDFYILWYEVINCLRTRAWNVDIFGTAFHFDTYRHKIHFFLPPRIIGYLMLVMIKNDLRVWSDQCCNDNFQRASQDIRGSFWRKIVWCMKRLTL